MLLSVTIDLGILLALGYQRFVEQLRDHLAGRGYDDLGRSDGFVLRGLDRAPMTTSQLAALLHISKQGAAQIVNDMQRRGYVEGRPDPADGRARLLHLAPRGQRALAEARAFHRRYERELTDRVGSPAVTALRAALTTIAGGEDRLEAGTPYV
jgi:DNA-binding MarR family transcriptional regulator